MKKLLFVALFLTLISVSASAQRSHRADTIAPKPTPWTVSFQFGHSLAFGDDSWDIGKDYKNARGEAWSVSLGYEFSPLITARLKGRYLKLYNRVNLEVLDAYRDKYPDFFPRDGFYGYHAFACQAEGVFNLTNLIPRKSHWFNFCVIAGVGFNTMFSYDENVGNWDGSYEGLSYPVDTRTHTMPSGVLGGMLDFRILPELSINAEALSTFTGDKMEGVKYEEAYDVYVTLSVGVTLHF